MRPLKHDHSLGVDLPYAGVDDLVALRKQNGADVEVKRRLRDKHGRLRNTAWRGGNRASQIDVGDGCSRAVMSTPVD